MKAFNLAILIFLFSGISICAQNDDVAQNKWLSISSRHAGICFGNSNYYNGLRLNILDRRVLKVNGINVSLVNRSITTNGLSVGLIFSADSICNGISFNGFASLGAKRNGIVLSCLFSNIDSFKGLGIAGIGIMGDTLIGFFAAGYGVISFSSSHSIKLIKGIAIGGIGVGADNIKGLAIGAMVTSKKQNGFSLAVYNNTTELHGLQIGLINHVANNPKGLRWLPLINLHI